MVTLAKGSVIGTNWCWKLLVWVVVIWPAIWSTPQPSWRLWLWFPALLLTMLWFMVFYNSTFVGIHSWHEWVGYGAMVLGPGQPYSPHGSALWARNTGAIPLDKLM